MNKFSLDDSSVVVVIGSGAGGGTVSETLARNGIGVVCLEAGRRLDLTEIVTDEAEMFGKITWLDERQGSGIAPPPFPVWNCKTVGGATMHWTATGIRLQEHEFNAQSRYGAVKGTTLVDWPLSLAELEPYYSAAEDRLGVTLSGSLSAVQSLTVIGSLPVMPILIVMSVSLVRRLNARRV